MKNYWLDKRKEDIQFVTWQVSKDFTSESWNVTFGEDINIDSSITGSIIGADLSITSGTSFQYVYNSPDGIILMDAGAELAKHITIAGEF